MVTHYIDKYRKHDDNLWDKHLKLLHKFIKVLPSYMRSKVIATAGCWALRQIWVTFEQEGKCHLVIAQSEYLNIKYSLIAIRFYVYALLWCPKF